MFRSTLISSIVILLCSAITAHATVWFLYEHEDGAVGNNLPSSPSGPYLFEYNAPGVTGVGETAKYANTSPRYGGEKYAELTTVQASSGGFNGYLAYVQNSNGTYGTVWDDSNPVTMSKGTTYYLAAFYRFERIDGNDIWHDTLHPNSFNKLFYFYTGSIRAGVHAGWDYRYQGSYDHKFTFDYYMSPTYCSGCEYAEGLQNVSPYDENNPYLCDYEKWYAVVYSISPSNDNTGLVELFINGTKVYSKAQKTQDAASASCSSIAVGSGTISQPSYDAPPHKIQFDGLIFTDDLATLQSAGYFSDPESPKRKLNNVTGVRVTLQ